MVVPVFRSVSHILLRACASRPFHEFLFWCLPAVLVGLGIRAALLHALPFATYDADSTDLLATYDRWLRRGDIRIDSKKTFLVPLVYMAAFWGPGSALATIAWGQHAVGLLLILMVGGLVRLWFTTWRLWIIPVTCLVALQPNLLWYEHRLMAESLYAAAAVAVALAGTALTWDRYAIRKRHTPSAHDPMAQIRSELLFGAFVVSLILVAGARPEGKLFFAFGALLILIVFAPRPLKNWRGWISPAARILLLAAIALALRGHTKSSQAGLLLYTQIFHLTPNHLDSAPGFAETIAPLRDELRTQWHIRPVNVVRVRRSITELVEAHIRSTEGSSRDISNEEVNRFCLRVARETLWHQPWATVPLAYRRLLVTINEWTGGALDAYWIVDKQIRVLIDDLELVARLSPALAGREMTTSADVERFVLTHFLPQRVTWFATLLDLWEPLLADIKLPNRAEGETMSTQPTLGRNIAGIPYFYWAAFLGSLALVLRPGPLRRFHVLWLLMLAFLAFVILLTANVKGRFRFVFEPFFLIYAFALCDGLLVASRRWISRSIHPSTPSSE